MWQGDGGVATASADILGKPELMSAQGQNRPEGDPVYPKLRTLVGAACRSLPGQDRTSTATQ
jgi:hypothetical protein